MASNQHRSGGRGAGKPPHAPGRTGGSRHGAPPAERERPPNPGRPPAVNPGSGGANTARPASAPSQPRLSVPAARPGAPAVLRPSGSRVQAPTGTVWLYGLHAVAAALVNPARRLRRLMLTEDAEAALAASVKHPWPLPHERTERARLDQLLGRETVHQGAALLADPLPTPVLTQVLDRPGPLIVLDQVTDPRNIGAILRSAAAFGAAGVVTQDRNAPEESGAMAKAASGALETMPLIRAVNLSRTLVVLKAAGLWVVGLDTGGPALSGRALRDRRAALVLGAEGTGLRRLTRDTCDEIAGLSIHGAMESLNVSAAAAVAMYELTRKPD